MCRPASLVITRTRVLWSRLGDSHEDIIRENKLDDSLRGGDFVRVEVVPPNDDYRMPLEKWIFNVDQSETPEWWDRLEGEVAAREELLKWAEVHIVSAGVIDVTAGMTRIVLGTAQVTQSGGECWAYQSAKIIKVKNV